MKKTWVKKCKNKLREKDKHQRRKDIVPLLSPVPFKTEREDKKKPMPKSIKKNIKKITIQSENGSGTGLRPMCSRKEDKN